MVEQRQKLVDAPMLPLSLLLYAVQPINAF